VLVRPLRVALVSMHTSPTDRPGSGDAGGMNVVERHQAESLAALGHDVELIIRRADPDLPEVVELSSGVRLRQVTAGPVEVLAKSRQDVFTDEFSARLAELEPYDLIHSHHWMSGVAALPVARTWSVPHVQSFHSVAALPGSPLAHGERPESPGRVGGEAMIAQRSDRIVAISRYEAATAVNRCGADPARVVVVPPGVDHRLFRPPEPGEPSWSDGRPDVEHGYVFFAARLQPLKAPDLAVAAMARVPAPIRPHLVVAGEGSADFPDYLAELDRLVRNTGLAGHVTFLGPQSREDLATLMRGARLMLVPSHSETFGLVALEAAASGVPVIAADAGGLGEAVVHGRTGLVLADRDADSWARAITGLLTDEPTRSAMASEARRHARGFDWGVVGERLSTIYADLVEEHR